ncbi:hypothetical protein NE237_008527 [Protea cynaroides]|uniref:C2H2-type domain-containing protein n=1 Tax=Protea cynaroides TaxID=273540 RepID=A0A9Q0KW20_9MAGN|nr:hypothetical protein NE237_008527 [Protea cynaroides]
MEFWGVEIKAGETLKVNPGDDKILHLSQANLGEVKKDKANESIPLFVKIGGQKLVIGTLSTEKCPQIIFDLVFEKEFELSHNWKNGSVYFIGYKSVLPDEYPSHDMASDSEEEDIPLQATENGKSVQKEQAKPATVKVNAAKPDSSSAKPKVKIVEPEKDDKSKDEDDDSDDEDFSEDDETDDEDLPDNIAGDDSDEDDEGSDEEEDEETPTPKKGKKRPSDSAAKTPASDKKAKLVTPLKTDGKKGGGVHTATPYPKQAAKTPNSDKAKGQTPKSGGKFSCTPCSKSFNSDGALQSHNKAKHTAGK